MTKPILYCVIWFDAHGDTVMFDEKDVDHKPYRFTSVGLLVRSDEIGVSLAREIGEDGRFRDHEFIPRVLILEEFSPGLMKKPKRKPTPSLSEPPADTHQH